MLGTMKVTFPGVCTYTVILNVFKTKWTGKFSYIVKYLNANKSLSRQNKYHQVRKLKLRWSTSGFQEKLIILTVLVNLAI